MKKTHWPICMVLVAVLLVVLPGSSALAAKPVVLGCPLSTAFLYGWDAERGVTLAVEEINAAGGVKVGDENFSRFSIWIFKTGFIGFFIL